MDYEKMYKEAMERARKALDKIQPENQGVIKLIKDAFPELAESEDERIRKELIGALMWQRDCLDAKGPHDNNLILPGFTMKVGDILRWLEKQKEQKPGPISCGHENGTTTEVCYDPKGDPDPAGVWKPSKEQIYSLGTVVKGYNECTVGSVGYHLKEMYEQLKKLI